jgi:hypothetical protein
MISREDRADQKELDGPIEGDYNKLSSNPIVKSPRFFLDRDAIRIEITQAGTATTRVITAIVPRNRFQKPHIPCLFVTRLNSDDHKTKRT